MWTVQSGFVVVWKATKVEVGRCQPSFTAVTFRSALAFAQGSWSSPPPSSSPLFQNLEESWNKILISVVRPSRATGFPVHSDWTWRSVNQSGWLRPPMLLLLSSAINKFTRWPLKDGGAGSGTSNVPGLCRSHYRNQAHTLPVPRGGNHAMSRSVRSKPSSCSSRPEWTRLKWLLTASGLQRGNFPDSNDDLLKM